jgi:quercetin dioxygenase-like cupin family protein
VAATLARRRERDEFRRRRIGAERDMTGKFIMAGETPLSDLGWGKVGMACGPDATGAQQVVVVEARFPVGKGHDFHTHPHQEEVIYVTAGRLEQWIDGEKRQLGPGDMAYIPAGVVHASFNVGEVEAALLAILGPCVGDDGVVTVEVAHEAAWKERRSSA